MTSLKTSIKTITYLSDIGCLEIHGASLGTQQYMEAMGVPGFMLPLVILLEFGGGLAILFGFLTRTTALFTAGFTLLTAFLFHSNFAEGVNSLMFMKNLTISGGFLLLAITGPGAYSIDRLLNKKW
ncbi:DoxX family protein [Escherichia coli]